MGIARQNDMELGESHRLFMKGDWVVYCKAKYTTHLGQRAEDIEAANGRIDERQTMQSKAPGRG